MKSVKAIAKRLRQRADSTLPESKPVPMVKRLTAGLKPGEVGVVGWQSAPVRVPARLQRAIEQSKAKYVKRRRYKRRFERLQRNVIPRQAEHSTGGKLGTGYASSARQPPSACGSMLDVAKFDAVQGRRGGATPKSQVTSQRACGASFQPIPPQESNNG